ncbi:Hypothetical protein CINCED_3A005812 [Cinara cedri]|nr:Hypothetical protein CINCED_3A005812 [Cinara cedri]
MSVTKKIFRLSQLIIEFLLHCKNHPTLLINGKVKCAALCEYCGKMFLDKNYLKYHCFRRHGLNSCTNLNSFENEHYVESLKTEITQLQNNLEDMRKTIQNKSQDFEIYQEVNDCKINCNVAHKNKLLYHLISQSGDNPMQIQEMCWKQKYNSLEKKYKILQNEYQTEQNTTKTEPVLHHKYQQCDLYMDQESLNHLQTVTVIEKMIPMCSSKLSLQKSDVISENEVRCMDIADAGKTKAECHRWKSDKSLDKDYSELIQLRQEASMNIIVNETDGDYEYSETLLHSDNVNQIHIVLTLRQIKADELLRNNYLIDLIKYDVKELVHKRLLEFYNSATEIDEHGAILHEQVNLCKPRESFKVSDCGDIKIEKHKSPKINCKPIEHKKKNTLMSKFKKKFHIGKVSSPDLKNEKTEKKPSIIQNLGLSHSSDISDNNDLCR